MSPFDDGSMVESDRAGLIAIATHRLDGARGAGAAESSAIVVALKDLIGDLEAGWLPGPGVA